MTAALAQQTALQVMVVLMLSAVGMRLEPRTLLHALTQRRMVAVMVGLNLVLVPLAAWGLTRALGLPSAQAAGVMLCAAAPAGPTGPVFTRIARGELAFATATMVLLSVLSVVTAPLTVAAALMSATDGPSGPDILRVLVLFQLLPLSAGVATRVWAPGAAARLEPWLAKAGNAVLIGIVITLLVLKGSVLLDVSPLLHVAMLALSLGSMGVGYLVAPSRALGWAAAMVTGVRNISVALLLSSAFANAETDAVVLAWAFTMLVVPAGLAAWGGRWTARPPSARSR